MASLAKLLKSAARPDWSQNGSKELLSFFSLPIRKTKLGMKINQTKASDSLRKHISELAALSGNDAAAASAVVAACSASLVRLLTEQFIFADLRFQTQQASKQSRVSLPQSIVFKMMAFESKVESLEALLVDLFQQLASGSADAPLTAACAHQAGNQLVISLGELIFELELGISEGTVRKDYSDMLNISSALCKVSSEICSEKLAVKPSEVICKSLNLQ